MGRVRVYLKTFETSGSYQDSYTEITEDVVKIGKINQKLDNSEYDIGIYRNSSLKITVRNDHGKFREASNPKSIFPFKRVDSIIRVTWDKRFFPMRSGFFKAYGGFLGQEAEVFKGLLSEVSSVSKIDDQTVDFQILGFESLFDRVETPFSSISNGDDVSSIVYDCLNQSVITNLLTVDPGNLSPDNDFQIDDKSDLENSTVKEVLASGLLLGANSVLYIENDTVYLSDRSPSASVKKTFYGQASQNGIENVVDVPEYRDGVNRVLNYITWNETSLIGQDAASQDSYGIRKKELSFSLVSSASTSKIQTILNAVRDEFREPKIELELVTPLEYDTLELSLLDKVQVDYPTVYRTADGSSLPRWGQRSWGQFVWPIGQWSLTIGTDKSFKIMGKSIDVLNETVTLSLREV